MGLFRKKSKDPAEYVDVETANGNLPVAVAVFPDAEPMPAPLTLPAAPPLPATTVASSHGKGGTIAVIPAAMVQKQHFIISREPTPLMPCSSCGHNARTRVTTRPNWITWCLVAILLVVFWPLFWLPLVMNSTRKSEHYCNHCNIQVGVVQPCEDCCVKHR